MALADASPCDCHVVPVRPRNAQRVFPDKQDDFADALDEAGAVDEDLAVCPNCLRAFPVAECGAR